MPSPPSNLSVSQNGLRSVLVTWAPSYGADFYTIYYMYPNARRSRESQTTEANDTSITLSSLRTGYRYSISMTANTGSRYFTALSSTEAGPVIITIGIFSTTYTFYSHCIYVTCMLQIYHIVWYSTVYNYRDCYGFCIHIRKFSSCFVSSQFDF